MSWFVKFPDREIINYNYAICKQYFPIGNVWLYWGVAVKILSDREI